MGNPSEETPARWESLPSWPLTQTANHATCVGGPVTGIDVLSGLRTLPPRLAAIADRCDPLALQGSFARAMLATEPCESGLYFTDEHFNPYAGALPVGKGWNTKRRHAEPCRVDTHVADARGRAICSQRRTVGPVHLAAPGAGPAARDSGARHTRHGRVRP